MPGLPLCWQQLKVPRYKDGVAAVKSHYNIGEGITTVDMYRLKA